MFPQQTGVSVTQTTIDINTIMNLMLMMMVMVMMMKVMSKASEAV